jgi:hypothetical protein
MRGGGVRDSGVKGVNDRKPLPFRGGVWGGAVLEAAESVDRPHPNPSPEGEELLS